MARSDLLLSLVKAGSTGNYPLFRKTVEALIVDERGKRHGVLADRLTQQLANTPSRSTKENDSAILGGSPDLFYEQIPKKRLSEIILSPIAEKLAFNLIEEQLRADLLRSYNLEPRHRLMFVGPPGNGKTSLAEALATEIMVPLITVRYEGLIGSYLGETATRLKKLFDYVRTKSCVLFFDEFETLGKERGDLHETGEIKRVVSSLLLQIDKLPSHVVVVTATNHPELLDRAAWRRFQLRIEMPSPTRGEIARYFDQMERKLSLPLGISSRTLADKLFGSSFSDLEEFLADVTRRYVLALPNANIRLIMAECLDLRKYRAQIRK